ncbi:MAG: DNA gyrase inhibitor YacG [Pseudomonadota bacterium]
MSERIVKGGHCPICGRPTERALRPFCSKRCADVDLGRWLTGAYAIPAEEAPEEAREARGDGSDRSEEPS